MSVVISLDAPQQQMFYRYAADMGLTEQEAAKKMFMEGMRHLLSPIEDEELPNPTSLQEAFDQGCTDLETARQRLHRYADKLAIEYDLL